MSETIPKNKKINGKTYFERTWGIKAVDLARLECVTPEALHMRVRNYGTPYQRSPKPSIAELLYGKTNVELAREVGCHPTAMSTRLKQRGGAYFESQYQHNLGKDMGGKDWKGSKWANKPQGWLHELHPLYHHWRFHMNNMLLDGYTLEQTVEHIQIYADNIPNRDYVGLWRKTSILNVTALSDLDNTDIVYPKPNLFSEKSPDFWGNFNTYLKKVEQQSRIEEMLNEVE